MFTGHLPELIIVLVVALIVFGPKRLPEVGNAVGKGLREFRKATSEIEDAVLHHDEADGFEDEDDDTFPHFPPEPEEDLAVSSEPTIDTLSQRRAMKQQLGDAPASVHEEEMSSPS
jgi:TatA/E family protein of Tat protein translocase